MMSGTRVNISAATNLHLYTRYLFRTDSCESPNVNVS